MATPNWALPQPSGSDLASTADDSIKAISDTLDNTTQSVTMLRKGLFSARPSAATAKSGCYYLATDTGVLYLSDGTTWVAINAADQAAGTASQRTLGTGAAQAAAGNHVHVGYGIVQGSTASEHMLYGKINSNGTRHSGSPGWTVARNAVGNYRITYGVNLDPLGGSNEIIHLTIWSGPFAGQFANHNTPQGTYVDVYTWQVDSNGNSFAADASFSFLVIGAT